MADLENLGIRIEVDSDRATSAVVSFTNQFRQATVSIGRDLNTIKSGASGAFSGVGSSIGSFVSDFGKAAIAVAGVTFAIEGLKSVIHEFTDLSDKATEVTSRLMAFTHSQGELEAAQQMVVKAARDTRSELPQIAELFQKIGIQADHLHLSLAQVGTATTVFAETLKLSGSTTAQSKAAMLQLGEAFDTGQLNGRHFNAMMMDNIVFMRLLAQSMGVPIGKLKELSKEGKVTSTELKKALTDPEMVAQVEKRFGALPVSFEQARTGIENNLTILAGKFANGMGISGSLAVLMAKFNQFTDQVGPKFAAFGEQVRAAFVAIQPTLQSIGSVLGPVLTTIGSNLGNIARGALVAAAGFTAFKLATAAAGFASTIGELVALEKGLGATSAMSAIFSVAMKSVQGAIRGVTAALAANPFTAWAVAITVAATAIYEFSDKIGISTKGMATLADYGNEILSRLAPAFKAIGDLASSVFGAIGDFAKTYLGPIGDLWDAVTSSMEFSFTGFVRFFARSIDLIISTVRASVGVIINLWATFPAMLQNYVAQAVNGAAALFETFINGMIGGFNKLSEALGIGTIGKVDLGRVKASGQTLGKTLKDGIGDAFKGKGVVEQFTDSLEEGAEKRAKGRQTASGGGSKPFDSSAVLSQNADDDPDGEKKKKKRKEVDKYAEEIKKLTDQLNNLSRSERDVAIAQAEGRAGLKEDPKALDAKSTAIRNLVNAVEDAKAIKTLNEHIADLRQQTSLLGQSERDASIAQELRSAGVNKELEDLAKLNPVLAERIALLKQEAGANFDAEQKKKAQKTAQGFTDRFADQGGEQNARKLELNGNTSGADERRRQTELAKTIQSIREAKAQNAQLDDQGLIAQATALSNQDAILDKQERMNAAADKLGQLMIDAWNDPMAALKKFLQELIAGLIKAVLKAVILNALMPGSGGTIGGNIKSMFGSMFGGGKAVGGSVEGGKSYLVGERGPEVIRMGAAGRVFPNHRLTSGGSGGVTLAPTYNIQMSGNTQQDNMTLASIKAQQSAQNQQIRSQSKVKGWQ